MPDITQERLDEIQDLLIETEIKRLEVEKKFAILVEAIKLVMGEALEVGQYLEALHKTIEQGVQKADALIALASLDDFWICLTSQHVAIAETAKLALQLDQGTGTQLT